MALCGSGFSQAWQGCPRGKEMAPDGKLPPEARCAGAPLTWLFLVGLLPSRARLRFTRQDHYRTARAGEKPERNRRSNEL